VADADLIEAGMSFDREVTKKSPLAVGNAKQVLNAALEEGTGVSAAMRLEREVTARYCLTSNDAQEGLKALSEKRKPRFTGSPVYSAELSPPAPVPDADNAFFWAGLNDRKVLLQRCLNCQRCRFPAMPSCPYCADRKSENQG
jgi:hypothetical protein